LFILDFSIKLNEFAIIRESPPTTLLTTLVLHIGNFRKLLSNGFQFGKM